MLVVAIPQATEVEAVSEDGVLILLKLARHHLLQVCVDEWIAELLVIAKLLEMGVAQIPSRVELRR